MAISQHTALRFGLPAIGLLTFLAVVGAVVASGARDDAFIVAAAAGVLILLPSIGFFFAMSLPREQPIRAIFRAAIHIRIRTLMVLVVLVAVVFSCAAWRDRLRRREAARRTIIDQYRTRAYFHEAAELATLKLEVVRDPSAAATVHHNYTPTPRSQYHARMKQKYLFAAEHPGLPVEPDPPEPQ
jgi:hypothetical protein